MSEERDVYEKLLGLFTRRGILWQSYEIYGGVAGFYDLGPIGVRIKNRIIDLWRKIFIYDHQEIIVEIETPIIAPSKVFEASGHLAHFTDPIVECLSCGRKFRADHLIRDKLGINVEGLSPEELTKIIRENNIKCPVCGGDLSDVKSFNLLFKTTIGPYSSNVGYLRPEAAQGMFVSFKRVYEALRKRLPLGIAQIGRVARNEISPRQGVIRLREFTIAEFEFFYDPQNPNQGGYLEKFFDKVRDEKIRILRFSDDSSKTLIEVKLGEAVEEGFIANKWLAYWMFVAQKFVRKLGVEYKDMFFEEKAPYERAHYSSQTFDQLVRVSRWGWIEVSGHSYRTDYDLRQHMQYSKRDLTVYRQYEKPIVRRVKRVVVDKVWLGRRYGSLAGKLLRKIKELSPEEIVAKLEKEGEIVIEGVKIPRDRLKVVEREEKISGYRFIPHVVEPSFGIERLLYVALEHAYSERNGRIILKLPRYLAPYDAAVFPLTSNKELVNLARRIYSTLIQEGFYVFYDEDGSIGKRYARADEVGIPIAITVDYQSLEDNSVTLRDRDSWEQVRVPIASVSEMIKKSIENNINIVDLQKKFTARA